MRWLLAVLAVCAIVLAPAAVRAGDYHSSGTLICSDCHTAHGSQQHVYNTGDPAASVTPIGPAAPYKYLLRNEENELCLTCHDGKTWAPDVYGANSITSVREAGALNAAAGAPRANDPGYDNIDGHSLWSTAVAPGGTFAGAAGVGLRCVDCHEQHGQDGTQYRNLQLGRAPNQTPVTYSKGATPDLTKDVWERNAPTGTVNYLANVTGYDIGDMDFCEPNTNSSAYANFCKKCHTNFHGTSGDVTTVGGVSGGDAGGAAGIPWLRHPNADVNIGAHATYISSLSQYSGHTNKVKVMDPSGTWGATANAGVTPSCFSCHKAHGNKNGFGLIYMAGSGPSVTEEGDGGEYKNLCQQCHIQG